MIYDVTVIGGGIVGMSTAYHILKKRPDCKILLLDKEKELAFHQSDRNSGVIHSGVYYEPGSKKAINCIKGYHMLLDFCDRHSVPYDLCGKVIIATKNTELQTLKKIFSRGLKNGLQGIKLLAKEEVLEKEPYVNVVQGIWVPEAGIIDYAEVTRKLGSLFLESGGEIQLNATVSKITESKDVVIVSTENGDFQTRTLINCAGLYADKVAKMTGMDPGFKIVPFRGEFYQLNENAEYLVNGLIYPVPDMKFPFLGVHFTKRIIGGIEAGPNAVLAFRREGYKHWDIHGAELWEALTYRGFQKLAARNLGKGMEELNRSFFKSKFIKSLQKLVPEITGKDVHRSRSGVRAQALDKQGNLIYDYVITENSRITNICNAPSPAATSGLAIGDFLSAKAIEKI